MPILDEPKAWDETFESDGELTALCGRTARTSSPLRTWTDITTDSDGTCWMTLDGKSSKTRSRIASRRWVTLDEARQAKW